MTLPLCFVDGPDQIQDSSRRKRNRRTGSSARHDRGARRIEAAEAACMLLATVEIDLIWGALGLAAGASMFNAL